MNRMTSYLLVIIMTSLVAACSTASKGTKPSADSEDKTQQKKTSTPGWFSKESVNYNADSIQASGTAIGSDSNGTVSKAEERATLLLQKSVSDKLEGVRSEAVKELGSSSGLDAPGFLIALRKADQAVVGITAIEHKDIKPIKDQESVRGFVQVSVSKKELIEDIGRKLATYDKAWSNLKNSASFQKF